MKHRKRKIALLVLAAALLLCCAAVGIYAADYYHIDSTAADALSDTEAVHVEPHDGMTVFIPPEYDTGLIFYPGGKVEYTAYAPLLHMLAESGVLCAVPKMPLNLAVMDVNASERITEQFPEIQSWYIGGHSLGGSMAASHAADCSKVKGLVLLAAYSTEDLSDTDLQVLSIYGTRDGVLNMEKYNEYRSNLPEHTTELVLEGGNHAQFGSYGEQDGDGQPLISASEQRVQTVSAIVEFIWPPDLEAHAYEEETYTFWLEQPGKTTLRSVLTLVPETGQFYLSEPIYSSRLNIGSYTIEDGILTCTHGAETVYRFDVADGAMIYRASDSAPLYAHGSVFAENPNEEKPVPNGAVYAALMICS